MIWVIAGTADGRGLAVELQRRYGVPMLVSVVSEYGAQLAAHDGIEVHTGRLDGAAMEALIRERGVRLLVDASHPYAAVVTATAMKSAAACGIPFIRFERGEVELPAYERLHRVKNEVDAADLAGRLGRRVYLTTGSKTMAIFAGAEALKGAEVWTRVLPTAQVVAEMEALGIAPKYIVGMQGPFSYEMNKIMFRDTKAEVVVMKNSGLVGGSDTKLEAAMDLGLHIVVIDRPNPAEGAVTVGTPAECFEKSDAYFAAHRR